MDLEKLVENFKVIAKDSFSNGIALNSLYTPLYALIETNFVGLSNAVSQDVRFKAILATYALGHLIDRGREVSKKIFIKNKKPSEMAISIHDAFYVATLSGAFNTLFYFTSGATDLKELAWASSSGFTIGLFTGTPAGYAMDWFKDLLGYEETERKMPSFVRNGGSKGKKAIAAGLVATAAGLTGLVYATAPDNSEQEAITIPSINQRYEENKANILPFSELNA